jgi:tetratricopeptide (TPR) repeat protein
MKPEYIQLLDELGKTAFTIPLILNLAHLQAFYLGETDAAITLLLQAISIPNVLLTIQAECKLELADIYLFSDEQWEATLLYSQVEKTFKNEPLGHEAKFRNAKLSFYIGEFGWAKAQLDVLKAATSKLIANDAMELSLLISDNIDMDSSYVALGFYSKADLMVYRNKTDEALAILDSVQMVALWHPLHDEVLFKKGEIMLKQGKFADADSLFAKVTEMYPQDILADNALMKRAEIYQYQYQDVPKAMELYEKIMFDYPGSLFVVEARKRYRELRGDVLN